MRRWPQAGPVNIRTRGLPEAVRKAHDAESSGVTRTGGRAMAPIVASIEIQRNPEDVFSYVTDPSRLTEWQESVVTVRREDTGPVSVGSREP
jgi:hypothetical protein